MTLGLISLNTAPLGVAASLSLLTIGILAVPALALFYAGAGHRGALPTAPIAPRHACPVAHPATHLISG